MTPPPAPPPPAAAGWGEAAGACPDGACASAAVAANDVAPAITAAARNPRRGMQQGQAEKAVRATVADMDGSGAKLRRAELRAVGRCPYTSPARAYGSAAIVAPRSLAPARRKRRGSTGTPSIRVS